MTGRTIYQKFIVFIEVLVKCYSLLPEGFRIITYSFFCDSHWFVPRVIRYLSFRTLCHECGPIINIGAGVTVKSWNKLKIGNRVNIHEYCFIDAIGEIEIGDDTSIAHHTSIVSFEHSWTEKTKPIKYNDLILKPIKIKGDVWIGCGVRILAGAYIGQRTILAAGAVATAGNYAGHIYGGVPAVPLKEIC